MSGKDRSNYREHDMNDSKYKENDPEKTLITLDQLSQTIEVMTSVVNRLRKHLSQQILDQKELEKTRAEQQSKSITSEPEQRESLVVEVSQASIEDNDPLDDKLLH